MATKKYENENIETNKKETSSTTSKKETLKKEKCKVLDYNETTKELDIEFKGYGVRINGVSQKIENEVLVKYYGEIGKPNFKCEL